MGITTLTIRGEQPTQFRIRSESGNKTAQDMKRSNNSMQKNRKINGLRRGSFLREAEVGGSNPLTPTNEFSHL